LPVAEPPVKSEPAEKTADDPHRDRDKRLILDPRTGEQTDRDRVERPGNRCERGEPDEPAARVPDSTGGQVHGHPPDRDEPGREDERRPALGQCAFGAVDGALPAGVAQNPEPADVDPAAHGIRDLVSGEGARRCSEEHQRKVRRTG
jgi:hypothetical protein